MSEENRVTSFKIGPNKEKISVEDLLMKLAMTEAVFRDLQEYIELAEANDGQFPENQLPPDQWAVIGAFQAMGIVSHALKCGCWGYQEACNH